MHININEITLRKPEIKDVEELYRFRNNPEIASLLGGFSTGYSIKDFEEWVEYHRKRNDEVLWIIADKNDVCIGHVGLYKIDYRIRSCEFAILIGVKELWNKGLGTDITKAVINYAFKELNMNRIELKVLETNKIAIKLYDKIGFKQEGILREAQYRNNEYFNVTIMGLVKREFNEKDT